MKLHSKLETKASPPRQCSTGRMTVTLPRRTLITMSIITMRSRLFPANSASDFLRFLKLRPQFCESCGAIYRWICETFSALQSTSGLVTDVENSFQIDAQLATLCFLKLVRKWPKNAVLNLALCCGAIWRHREKPQYRCTTTIHPILYTTAQKDFFFKFTSCRTFGAHKLVLSELFLDYFYELWHLLSALGSDMRKNFI